MHGLGELAAADDFGADLLLYSDVAPPPAIRRGPWEVRQIPRPRVPAGSRWWSLAAFPLAARRDGADVVHTQYTLSPLVRRGGVSTIHDVSFFVGPEWFRPRDRFLLSRSIPATCRRAARILTVSETSRAEIERFIPAARGKVIVGPNGLPTWFRPVPRGEAAVRVADALDLRPPYLLTVGTRWPRKNLNLAVAAVAGLPPELPHRLAVTGQPGWGDEVPHPRAVRTGWVDDDLIGALYAAADAYLAPSLHEGFGIPMLEAWAAGCPVVCGAGGALPEVAGDAAVVVPTYAAADWTTALAGLLADPDKLAAMREAGRVRLGRFTWADCARAALRAYREAAA